MGEKCGNLEQCEKGGHTGQSKLRCEGDVLHQQSPNHRAVGFTARGAIHCEHAGSLGMEGGKGREGEGSEGSPVSSRV